MLAVVETYRGRGIAKQLVSKAVQTMKDQHADEIVLEVEAVNNVAIHLYETVGFMRSKRLHHHYLNSNDAFRLILPLSDRSTYLSKFLPMLDNSTLPAAAA
jgi:peptide alpha-N-acetyltransferase